MTTAAFLHDLHQRGVILRADGDALSLRAPKGVLTDDDRERLQADKAAILAVLTAPSDDAEPFSLTDIQQAYLIGRSAELALGQVGCHAYREFDRPTVDLPRIEQAWNRLVVRHPMLRAVFSQDGRQRVLPSVPAYAIEVLDLRANSDAASMLAALRDDRSHRVFDPARWPLFEIHATLLPDRVRLSVGIDLLVADAAALITLFREWGALYEAPGRALAMPAGQFADHVRNLPRLTPAERAYWDARLDSLPQGPDLPLLPSAEPPRFSRRSIRLDAPRWQALKQAASSRGLTASVLVAAVYADMLARCSRRARFSLTLTQFAAPPGMDGVVGDFTSTVLLEVDCAASQFADRAMALQRRLLADLDHSGQHGAAQNGVAVLRDIRRRRPDFEPIPVVFTSTLGHPGLDPDAPSPLAWLGGTVHAITQTPQVVMDHHVIEEAGALVASWDVIEALFPDGVLDGMVAGYRSLLNDLVDETGWTAPVAGTPRAAMAPGPIPALLHAAFERQAAATPSRAAVIAADRTLDYATLNRAATWLAARILQELGVARDRLVAVELAKGWRQVVAVLAILKAGAAYLPIDPALPAERRRALISRSQALTIDPAWLEAALRHPMSGCADPVLPVVTEPERLAYVIYTSGSTGQPKGVMIEHRAAFGTVADVNRRWGLGPDDRVFGLSSLSFDLSVWDMFGPLSVGGALVLPGPDALRDPAAWAGLLTRHRVTVWNSVPALMAMQIEHGLPDRHALRLVMLSGDWVPLALVNRLRAVAPAARLVALGGATEAAIWSNAQEIDDLDPAWPSIPYGTPLAGQKLHVVNQRGGDCPDWVIGEIEITGAGLARGYWHDPERTAERFVLHSASGERRYRTGDLGRFRPHAQGGSLIEFLGREDFQVKVQGHRIELGEIEAALSDHPDVERAVVVVLPQRGAVPIARHDAMTSLKHDLSTSLQGDMIGMPSGGETTLHAFVVPRKAAWDRARFLLARHGLRPLSGMPRVNLAGRPTVEMYDRRRSVRRYTPGMVTLGALSTVLAAAGTDLVVQVVASRVEGLSVGLWRYQPDALRRVADGSAFTVPDAGTARIAADAAFVVMLDAVGQDTGPALLAAGAAGQRMMLAAQAAGLGLCPIGVLRRDGAAALHALAGGAPAAETGGFDFAGALREHCATLLPAWMVPRHVHLREALPLTANGKVDRAALLPPEDAPPVAVDDALVAAVGALVADVIGQPVHPQQNLFDCGATSLHIVRLQRLLAERLGSRLAVVDLFRLPSVAALASAMTGELGPDPVDAGLTRAARRRQLRAQR